MTTARATKVIKRYANRKLYDTERSCYVTLEEIAIMVKDGDEVRVIDNKTKDDLTAVTLAQIIVEEEKKVQKMPLKLLRSIIQSGNDAVSDFYEKRVADPVKTMRDDLERRVDHLLRRDRLDEKVDEPSADESPMASGVIAKDDPRAKAREFVASTMEALETWQKGIDARVQDLLHREGRPDLATLRARIAALEAKIAELESTRR
jgi:polyhydroxyalkanoate synthesis repressor PhaR